MDTKDIIDLFNTIKVRQALKYAETYKLKNSTLYDYFSSKVKDPILGPIIQDILKEHNIIYNLEDSKNKIKKILSKDTSGEFTVKFRDVLEANGNINELLNDKEFIEDLNKHTSIELYRILNLFQFYGSADIWHTFITHPLVNVLLNKYNINDHKYMIHHFITHKKYDMVKYFVDHRKDHKFYDEPITYYINKFSKYIYHMSVLRKIEEIHFALKYLPFTKEDISNVFTNCILGKNLEMVKLLLDYIK